MPKDIVGPSYASLLNRELMAQHFAQKFNAAIDSWHGSAERKGSEVAVTLFDKTFTLAIKEVTDVEGFK